MCLTQRFEAGGARRLGSAYLPPSRQRIARIDSVRPAAQTNPSFLAGASPMKQLGMLAVTVLGLLATPAAAQMKASYTPILQSGTTVAGVGITYPKDRK